MPVFAITHYVANRSSSRNDEAPEVLEAADEVTAANTDDGVALLLERILARNGGNFA